jgi:beta-lactam-binding protein with PASTA domain
VITLYTSNGSLKAVPNVTGQKLSDAQKALTDAGFTVKVTGGNDPNAPVTAQDPAAAAGAKPGAPVTLTVTGAPAPPTPGVGK